MLRMDDVIYTVGQTLANMVVIVDGLVEVAELAIALYELKKSGFLIKREVTGKVIVPAGKIVGYFHGEEKGIIVKRQIHVDGSGLGGAGEVKDSFVSHC